MSRFIPGGRSGGKNRFIEAMATADAQSGSKVCIVTADGNIHLERTTALIERVSLSPQKVKAIEARL